MGRASADLSTSGRRRRGARFWLRRHRSPTPTSADATSEELTPLSYVASDFFQQPSNLPYPDNATISPIFVIVPLPVFRGDPGECPDAHLGRFDRVCRANGNATSATAARIFPASLDADAALWYELSTTAGAEAASSTPPWEWDVIRAAFLEFFRQPGAADRAREELRSLRQRPGETVNRYHLRMQGILRRFPDGGVDDVPNDAFLRGAFVDGLHTELKEWVVPQDPETLDLAVSLALSCEGAESLRAAQRTAKEACDGAAEKCAFCGVQGHQEALREVWRRLGDLLQRSSSSMREGGATPGRTTQRREAGARRWYDSRVR